MPEHHYSRVCDGCGVTFSLPKKDQRRRFCSSSCWYAFNRRPLAERLWAKVDKDGPLIRPEFGPCWEWIGSKLPRGYGHVWDIDAGHHIYTHRAAWKIAAGEDAGDLNVLHVCDNPSCVRNDELGVYVLRGVAFLRRGHLFLGTTGDNSFDKVDKGRAHHPDPEAMRVRVLGEKNPMCTLTETDIHEIRRRFDSGIVTQKDLAAEFGVGHQNIHLIVRRKSWRHL